LTKYKANRSFVEWSQKTKFTALDYDGVKNYTENLFESYMAYKQLLNVVQAILTYPEEYNGRIWIIAPLLEQSAHSIIVQKDKHNAIPIDVPTLIAVRAELRLEMNKIVNAVRTSTLQQASRTNVAGMA